MAEALYQKYRPARFTDVYGEQHVVQALQRAAAAGALTHAYVLYGPRGVGKTTIAKLLAKTVNCLSLTPEGACGKCENCVRIATNKTLDVIEQDAASNNGISEIRTLIDTVSYLPTDLKYKVYILDEAHMLTVGAWNALLKTLEDCPPHVLFIFATTEQHKIPLTIISRCQCFGLRPLAQTTIFSLLQKIAKAEKIRATDEALNQLAHLARGSARDAITMLDQLRTYAVDKQKLSLADVESVFGLLGLGAKIAFINKLAANDAAGATKTLDDFEAAGINLALLTSDLLALCIDIYLALHKNAPAVMRVLDKQTLKDVHLSGTDALICAEIFEELVGKIRFSPDVKTNLQIGVFRALHKMQIAAQKEVQTSVRQLPPLSIKNAGINPSASTQSVAPKETATADQPQQALISTNSDSKVISSPEVVDQNASLKQLEADQPVVIKQDKNDKLTPKTDVAFDLTTYIRNQFMAISNAFNQEAKAQFATLFKKIKQQPRQPGQSAINAFRAAQKVVLASPDGLVLSFADPEDALTLNEAYDDPGLIRFIREQFGRDLIVIGTDNDALKTLTFDFAKQKAAKSVFPQLQTAHITSSVGSAKTTADIAYDFFGDDLQISQPEAEVASEQSTIKKQKTPKTKAIDSVTNDEPQTLSLFGDLPIVVKKQPATKKKRTQPAEKAANKATTVTPEAQVVKDKPQTGDEQDLSVSPKRKTNTAVKKRAKTKPEAEKVAAKAKDKKQAAVAKDDQKTPTTKRKTLKKH